MFRKFLPRRDLFFAFFEQHATISCQAAEQLLHLVTKTQSPHETFETIKNLESEADIVAYQCVEALHKTFITPMDRMDIHHLISTLDDIADEIEDIAKLLFLYKLDQVHQDVIQLAQIILQAVHEVWGAIKELRKMEITPALQAHFFKIDHLENEADSLLTQALTALFDEEQDIKALIKWKEVYERMESVTDVCRAVSHIIEGIILENE